jgi:predicted ArsR family transcriptional regulator
MRTAASQKWKILNALKDGPMDEVSLMPLLGLSRSGVNKYLSMLRKEKQIRIAEYRPTGRRPTPLYGLGNKPDAVFVATHVRKPRQPCRKTARREIIIAALKVKPRTAEELGVLIHTTVKAAREYLRELRAPGNRMVYIKSYRPAPAAGFPAPVYALGNQPDAPLRQATRAERYIKDKADPAKYARMLERRRIRYHAAKKAGATASPFAALGV